MKMYVSLMGIFFPAYLACFYSAVLHPTDADDCRPHRCFDKTTKYRTDQ